MSPLLYFVRIIINMVSLCSYGMTFFLYVLTSGGLRKQLRDLFCCKERCCTFGSTEPFETTSVDTGITGSRSQMTTEEELGVSVIYRLNSSRNTTPNCEEKSLEMVNRSDECTALL